MDVPRLQILLCLSCAGLALSLAGCGAGAPTYQESDTVYTSDSIDSQFNSSDYPSLLGKPLSEVPALRHKALVGLRKQGAGAAVAADTITETFPAETIAVPVHIERARFDGDKALIVVELIGPQGGSLQDVRVWVLGETGDVLYSTTR
jgi:hypothetical protein